MNTSIEVSITQKKIKPISIKVLFDNEDRYECRLDLGFSGNDVGFAGHCLSMLAYYLRHQYDLDKSWLHDRHHLSLIEANQSYEFDSAFVENARQDIQ
ncbi:hypothetical protein [Vibrio owensii]|uniref:hypothetical protein n=1 Tax=Vibrio owensii TaxID=696485 RepID=UPI0040693120